MYYLMADVVDVFKANAAVDLILYCSAHCITGGDDDDGDDDNDDDNDGDDLREECRAWLSLRTVRSTHGVAWHAWWRFRQDY